MKLWNNEVLKSNESAKYEHKKCVKKYYALVKLSVNGVTYQLTELTLKC